MTAPMRFRLRQLATAVARRDDAMDSFKRACLIALPPGMRVNWERGGGVQYGQIIEHGYRAGTVLVENARSGARYKISVDDILYTAKQQGWIP